MCLFKVTEVAWLKKGQFIILKKKLRLIWNFDLSDLESGLKNGPVDFFFELHFLSKSKVCRNTSVSFTLYSKLQILNNLKAVGGRIWKESKLQYSLKDACVILVHTSIHFNNKTVVVNEIQGKTTCFTV